MAGLPAHTFWGCGCVAIAIDEQASPTAYSPSTEAFIIEPTMDVADGEAIVGKLHDGAAYRPMMKLAGVAPASTSAAFQFGVIVVAEAD